MAEAIVYGIRIDYEITGEGEETLVFMHGWCSDKSIFKEQVKVLSKRYRCITLDLPGFGKSSKPSIDFTMTIFGEVMIGFIHKLRLQNPILVGHSLGGLLAIEMCWQQPDIAKAVILLDPAPIIADREMLSNMDLTLSNIEELGLSKQLEFLVNNVFFRNDDDQAFKDKALRIARKVPTQIAKSSWKSMMNWNGKRALKMTRVPLLYIAAENPMNKKEILDRYADDITWGQAVLAGHSCPLTTPNQVNAMIEQFLISKL